MVLKIWFQNCQPRRVTEITYDHNSTFTKHQFLIELLILCHCVAEIFSLKIVYRYKHCISQKMSSSRCKASMWWFSTQNSCGLDVQGDQRLLVYQGFFLSGLLVVLAKLFYVSRGNVRVKAHQSRLFDLSAIGTFCAFQGCFYGSES